MNCARGRISILHRSTWTCRKLVFGYNHRFFHPFIWRHKSPSALSLWFSLLLHPTVISCRFISISKVTFKFLLKVRNLMSSRSLITVYLSHPWEQLQSPVNLEPRPPPSSMRFHPFIRPCTRLALPAWFSSMKLHPFVDFTWLASELILGHSRYCFHPTAVLSYPSSLQVAVQIQ